MDINLFIAAVGLCLRAVQEGGSNNIFPFWKRGTGGAEVRMINDRIDVCLRKSAKRDATEHYHLVLLDKPTIHQLTITTQGTILDACDLPEHAADAVLQDICDTFSAPEIEWHDWDWVESPAVISPYGADKSPSI